MAAPTRVDRIHDYGIQLKPAAQQSPPQQMMVKWQNLSGPSPLTNTGTPIIANQAADSLPCKSGLMGWHHLPSTNQ
jgi:hypothetical protein